MPFTKTIVNFVNDYLKVNALNKSLFQPVMLYGIASTIPGQDDPAMLFPGVINDQGNIEAVQPDDQYNLSVYHKILSNNYSLQKKGSYGDDYDMVSLTEMQLFVFAQGDKIKMTAEQLEPHLVFGLPLGITKDLANDIKIKSCLITVISSDMDKIRNFKSEFQGIKMFLVPEHIFFSIRYQIKKVFDRSCVDACLCS